MCDSLCVKVNELDMVSLYYGLEINLDYLVDEPELPKAHLRKIELKRQKDQNNSKIT